MLLNMPTDLKGRRGENSVLRAQRIIERPLDKVKQPHYAHVLVSGGKAVFFITLWH
jgi:hypothetical protein